MVYKARDRNSGEIVALKKLRMDRERDGKHLPPVKSLGCTYGARIGQIADQAPVRRNAGMPVTSVRELRVLQSCR